MKTQVVIRFLLATTALALVFGCVSSPRFGNASIREVRFRDGIPGEQVAVATEGSGLDAVVRALERAKRISVGEAEHRRLRASLCFDVIGDRAVSGRWLYDPESGMFSKLDHRAHPVFRMAEDDRVAVNALFLPWQTKMK